MPSRRLERPRSCQTARVSVICVRCRGIAHCSPGHAAVTLQPRASKVDARKVQADKRLQSEGTGSHADGRPACQRMWRCIMHCSASEQACFLSEEPADKRNRRGVCLPTLGSVLRQAGELARTVRRPAAWGLVHGPAPQFRPSQWHTPLLSPATAPSALLRHLLYADDVVQHHIQDGCR
jgi:hypothetical protein